MTAEQQAPTPGPLGPIARYEKSLMDRITDFDDPRQEWRRLFSELLGTFFLVLVGGRRRDDGPRLPGHDQPQGRRRGARR